MTQLQQKLTHSLLWALVFGLSFSFRSWQLCCTDFSSWSLLNTPSLFSFLESAIFGFIVFFMILSLRCNGLLKMTYASYVLAVIFLESPFRFYATSLVTMVAGLHAIYFFTVKKGKGFEVGVFLFLTALIFALFPWVSPFHFDENESTSIRMTNSMLYLLQPSYRGFISAKLLNFSSIDYSFFASATDIAVGNNAFLLQVLGYIFDLPSISTSSFFFLLDLVGLSLLSIGSFCTYLLFKEYFKASTTASLVASLTLFILNKFLIESYTGDSWLFVSCYSLTPLAIIAGIRVLREEKNSIITCAFILALPFILIAPHPNYYMIMVATFFALMVFLCAEWETDFKIFCKKLSRIVAALLISLLFSAYYLLPVIKQYLAWDCHAFPHEQYHCNCANEVLITQIFFLVTAFLSIKYKKIKIGFYFSTALLIFIYLVNKTTILDFAVSAVFGGIPARLPLSLWFLSFFIILYYGRNFSPKIMIAIFVVISSFSDPLEIQILKTKQSYHIFLEAELASFPALQKDQSNSLYIKNKIIKYEKDFPQNPLYQAELKIFNIRSIKDSTREELFQIAQKTAKIIDTSYASKIPNLDAIKFYQAISPYNIGKIYNGLEPFHRIESATNTDFHSATGPGLLMNNSSTNFDPRFMTAYIPTEFLYIMKNRDYLLLKGWWPDDTIVLTLPWSNFDPTHSKTKHMMNLSGVDYITSDKQFNNLIKLKTFDLFNSQYHLYQNPNSYGVSYIANVKDSSKKQDILAMKAVVKDYFKSKTSYKNYDETITKYEQQLFALQNKYDAIVEDNEDLKNNSGYGKSRIHNMLGNIIITNSTCQNTDCILSLNFSHLPQWKAFSQNFSQLKIYDVNFAFMGVRVAQGAQKVMFIYLSYLNEAGIILSLLMASTWIWRLKRE